MSTQEIAPYIEPVAPALPPLPTFDEHLETLDVAIRGYECRTENDFKAGKALAERCSRLKSDISISYQIIKRAYDALKEPVLGAEKRDMAKVKSMVDWIDAECVPWKQEQDRIAQQAANQRREAERLRLEAERAARLETAKAEAAAIEAERLRLESERVQEGEVVDCWGDEVDANELDVELQAKLKSTQAEIKGIEAAPAVAVRAVTIESEFSYRRGGRTKPKLEYRVVNPGQVKRDFCQPSKIAIDAKIYNFSLYVKEPTVEQIAALTDEIGGVIIELVQP